MPGSEMTHSRWVVSSAPSKDTAGERHWVEAIPINLLDDPLVAGIVVHTRDITMVCPKTEAQRVKDLVGKVKEKYGAKFL